MSVSRDIFIKSISALDARTDSKVNEYFVLTNAIGSIREATSDGVAVVGLKGAGKTTLYRALTEGWGAEESAVSVGLSTDVAAFETYFDQINCLQFERSVKIGMALFILKLIDENVLEAGGFNDAFQWLERRNEILAPGSRLDQALKRSQGLAVMGIGLSVRTPDASTGFDPITTDDVSGVMELLREFNGSGHKLRIVVDDPDRLFTKGTSFDPHLLAGYILGTNWLARELDFINFVHVVKSNVFDALWEVEEIANLPYDYFRYISWNRDELKALVTARISHSGADASEIFEDSENYSIDIFMERIRNGPRDLLRFLEIILKVDSTAKVGPASIAKAAPAFKQEARRQMESVYLDLYAGIDGFCSEMFAQSATLPVAGFSERFQIMRLESRPVGLSYAEPWVRSADRALKGLLDAGVVDVFMNGRWIRPYEAEYFRFNPRDAEALVRRNWVFQNAH